MMHLDILSMHGSILPEFDVFDFDVARKYFGA